MKQIFIRACLVAAAMFALAGSACAQTVVSADGAKVLGTHSMLAVYKDPNSAKAWALYGSGWQDLADTPTRTKYAALLAGCGSRCVLVDGDATGLAIAAADSNGIYCSGGKSLVGFSNRGQPMELNDGCAFWTKAKQTSQ